MLTESALTELPPQLRKELLATFNRVLRKYVAGDYEPSELNGGKFCEIVYTILRGYVDGTIPQSPKKPANFVRACTQLEQAEAQRFPRSVRIHIPRVLIALYEVRNNRNVGHVGGDVDPNHMDAVWVVASVKWVLAELVRIFHQTSVDEATSIVEALTDRTSPAVWEVDGTRRVLNTEMTATDRTLMLLYANGVPAPVVDLIKWSEYGNASRFRSKILGDLHRAKLIEFDRTKDLVHLSPPGHARVERELL